MKKCMLSVVAAWIIGCQSTPPRSEVRFFKDTKRMEEELLQFVKGKSLAETKKFLESNGFDCKISKSKTNGIVSAYLYCDAHRKLQPLVYGRWQAKLFCENGKIESAKVAFGYIGM